MNQNNIFSSIVVACRRFYGRNIDWEQDEFPYYCASAAGLLPGVLMAVIGAAFVFIMGRIGGGIMAALILPLFLEMLTGWRGITVTVAWIERLVSGKQKSEGRDNTDQMQRQVLFASIYLFRMVAFGLLAAGGNAVWIVYVLGGSYLIRGELLKDEDEFEEDFRFGGWILYLIFALLAGLLAFHWNALASLPLAVVLTVLLLIGSRRFIEKFFERTEFWATDLLGYFSENLMLFAGLILFGRQIYG